MRRSRTLHALCTAAALVSLVVIVVVADDWIVASPESQGLSHTALDTLRDGLAQHGTRALLVVRHDRIVYEWYAPGHTAGEKQGTASLAKAMVGGLSLAIALNDHRIASLDDRVAKYVPQWKGDARRSRITLRQLGSHTSGLDDAEANDLPHDKLTGWQGDFWKRLDPPRDPFTLSRDETPLVIPVVPGPPRESRSPRPTVSRRLRHLRRPRTLGPLDHCLFHQRLGRRPGRHLQPHSRRANGRFAMCRRAGGGSGFVCR